MTRYKRRPSSCVWLERYYILVAFRIAQTLALVFLIVLSGCDSRITQPSPNAIFYKPLQQLGEVVIEFDREGNMRAFMVIGQELEEHGFGVSALKQNVGAYLTQDSVKCDNCGNGTAGEHNITVYLRNHNQSARLRGIELRDKYCYNCTWVSDSTNPSPLPDILYGYLFDVRVNVDVPVTVPAVTKFQVRFTLWGEVLAV